MKVSIEDISCIENLDINIPDDVPGGVLVFRARNGGGKTSAINIVNAIVTGTGKLIPHDDAAKGKATLENGEAKAKITAGGTTRRTGDAEIPNLEGRFDFADLVCPSEKSSEAREKKRIKALVTLAGSKADASVYYDLFGGQENFEKIIGPDDLKTDDAVELAGRIQRAAHAAAKAAEDLAKHAEGHAAAARASAEGVDLGSPDDSRLLENALIEAVGRQTALETKRKAWTEAQETAALARKQLEQHDSQKGLIAAKADYEAAQQRHNAAFEATAAAERALVAAQKAFAAAERRQAEAKADVLAKEGVLKAAEKTAAATKGWQEQIEAAASLANPTDDEIATAKADADLARTAISVGALVRKAKEQLQVAAARDAEAKALAAKAEDLREAARSVDTILSGLIPPGKLRVRKGVVVLDTDRGENVPYDECSDGEKWSVALPYGITRVGAGGIICVPQDAWQHLDHDNKVAVAKTCLANEVWLVTGEVADGELRAEVFAA